MAFTKVVGAGIHTLSNITSHNINSSGIITATKFVGPMENGSGISTFYDLRVTNNLTVDGTTTTLDTKLVEVDKIEVEADSTNVAIAVTQTGTGDLIRLYDGASQVVTVDDEGQVGIGTVSPTAPLHLHKASGDTIQKIESSNGASVLELRHTNGYGYINYRQSGAEIFRVGQIAQFTSYSVYNPNSSLPYQLCVEGNGEVGINTHNPGDTLHLLRNSANHGIRLQRAGTNPGSAYVQVHSNGVLSLQGGNNIHYVSGGSQQHIWYRASTEIARFDTSGRLGIGTDNPSGTLTVHGLSSSSFRISKAGVLAYDHTFDGSTYEIKNNNGSAGIPLIIGTKTAGGESLRIAANGRVGIGTDNPNAQLDVYKSGTGTVVDTIITRTSGGGAFAVQCSDVAAANPVWALRTYSSEDLVLSPGGHANANEKVRIKASTGFVGIGTEIPDAPLHVLSDANNMLQVESTDRHSTIYIVDSVGSSFIQNDSGELRFGVGGGASAPGGETEAVRIDSDGFVGIGTHNPDHSLHVYKEGGDSVITIESTGDGNDAALEFYRTSSGGNSMGAGSIYVTGNTSASEAIMHFGVGHNISHGQVPRLSIKGDGEVGIGTDDPDTTLHIRSSFPTLLIEGNNDTVGYTVSKVDVRANFYRKAGYVISDGNGNEDIFMGRPYGEGDTTATLVFNFQGSEKVRFSSDGRVGINTTNPHNKQLSVKINGLDDNTHLLQTSYRSGNNAPGYTASGLQILSSADSSSGEQNTAFLSFSNRSPALNGSHGANAFITMTTPNSQSTYGTGQIDFYIRNGSAYAFPNDPQASSGYWMPSLFTIKSNGNIGIGETFPDRQLHISDPTNGGIIRLTNTDTTIADNAICGMVEFEQRDSNTPGVSANIRAEMRDTTNGACSLKFTTGTPTTTGTRMTIRSDGNIGIANENPQSKLEVAELATGQSETQKRIAIFRKNGTAVGDEGYIHLTTMTGHYGVKLGYRNEGGSPGYLNQGFFISTVNSGETIDNHTKKFVIKSGGNIGIGTDSPATKLHLQNGDLAIKQGALYVSSDRDAAVPGSSYGYQVMSGYKVFSDSDTWLGLAYVGHSHSIEVQYMIIENGDTSKGGAHGYFHVFTTYGNGTVYNHTFKRTAMNGGRITSDPSFYYCNGTCGSHGNNYVLRAKVSYTGTDNFAIHYTIKGVSSGNMYV